MDFAKDGKMLNRIRFSIIALAAVLTAWVATSAQNNSKVTWPEVDWHKPPLTPQNRKPAPKRDISGSWSPAEGPNAGTQAKGVQLMPSDGNPAHDLPLTPHGLEVLKTHKPTEGMNLVPVSQQNDPRNLCEPLGFPRWNHYTLRFSQIFQDAAKVAVLYDYDNRWRDIWIDGRPLPKVLDGGVEIDGQFRESRWMGYSVGKWIDDQTLEVQTVGTMPEDLAWLDNAGRPISDQALITETFRRVDNDTLEWSETVDDPKMYTKPWEAMKFVMRLQDIHTEENEDICSPALYKQYLDAFGSVASKP
jgi:hypothetical protein